MFRRYIEILLLSGGLCMFATAGLRLSKRAVFERRPQLLAPLLSPAQVLGKLEVPRIALSVPVVEGDDETALSFSAGHVPGSAAIGSSGNAVIAGHRDADFRDLRNVEVGDHLRIKSGKTYIYVVKRIRVVDSSDTSALQERNRAMLTLVTCYPFHYVGSAPQRYIVQADLAGN